MSGSQALRRLLYIDTEEGSVARRGYHYEGTYEPLLRSTTLEQPAAVLPRSGFRLSCACLAGCLLGCLTMKARNMERWWLGLFFMCGMYYNAVKAHKVNNGLVGHQSGFFAAGMGVLGCGSRLVVRAGSRRNNVRLLSLFSALMWYEVGRYHLWAEHVSEFRREVTPERTYNLLTEYVPQGIDTVFLPYRSVSSR
ncbi:hypothetical protein DQ04_00811030 [Trypanosoma grayi]|uniref:hypothetical protein n=1 Tax=Trypanosoma grayi TaxID=71804 RepID=UPI0004F45971|nr:hypothetical protein DQ04_00811030 [Trypanosoma grayi]KEG13743.1 hypothetical protein DQ04_00811030 [Trypanosoma grayi]